MGDGIGFSVEEIRALQGLDEGSSASSSKEKKKKIPQSSKPSSHVPGSTSNPAPTQQSAPPPVNRSVQSPKPSLPPGKPHDETLAHVRLAPQPPTKQFPPSDTPAPPAGPQINKETTHQDVPVQPSESVTKKETLLQPEESKTSKPASEPLKEPVSQPSLPVEKELTFAPAQPTLDDIEKLKKEMEAMNQKRKQLLLSEIRVRQTKTMSEAQQLQYIQNELAHLDTSLSHDISIIRQRIEEINRDHDYSRRRFEAAEKEYIESKLDLQKKRELKEQLTEHLMMIIQQNEMRKAKKLEELMSRLQLSEAQALRQAEERLANQIKMEAEARAKLMLHQQQQQQQQQLQQQQQQQQPEPIPSQGNSSTENKDSHSHNNTNASHQNQNGVS